MYNKEKAKQNYIENRDKLNEKAKQYYHNHKEERKTYNNKYWEEHKHIYVERRKKDREDKNKQKEYYKVYKYSPSIQNKKLEMILNNHKPQPLILSHTVRL